MITLRGASKYHGLTIRTTCRLLLSWKPHINKVQDKASKTIGLLKRTLNAAQPQVRQTAYEVFVRPTLEFATCAWAPHTKTGIQTIVREQRSAARFVTGDYRRTSCVTDNAQNCFSVNHELPALLFNVLIMLLVYLLLFCINVFIILAHSVISFILVTVKFNVHILYLYIDLI